MAKQTPKPKKSETEIGADAAVGNDKNVTTTVNLHTAELKALKQTLGELNEELAETQIERDELNRTQAEMATKLEAAQKTIDEQDERLHSQTTNTIEVDTSSAIAITAEHTSGDKFKFLATVIGSILHAKGADTYPIGKASLRAVEAWENTLKALK